MYAAAVDGQPLTFTVAGVWRRNMVIRDRQTGSVWQQADGTAIAGPYKGRKLALIGGNLIRWEAWRDANPEGKVGMEPDPPAPNLLSVEGMGRLFARTDRITGPGLAARGDKRLPMHTNIIGIVVEDAARAYPIDILQAQDVLEDTLAGVRISLRYDADADAIFVTADGEPIPALRQWWLGWCEFHPHTDVYRDPLKPTPGD